MRISTQSEAAKRRRDVSFCYMCGESLDRENINTLTKEHIVPKAFLQCAPSTAEAKWPILLDVHKKCECSYKRTRDHWLKLYSTFMNDPDVKTNELVTCLKEIIATKVFATAAGNHKSQENLIRRAQKWGQPEPPNFAEMGQLLKEFLFSIDMESNAELSDMRNRCIELIRDIHAPQELLQTGHYRSAPIKVDGILDDQNRITTKIAGMEEIRKGILIWICGFHAFLYGESPLFISLPFSMPQYPIFGATAEKSIEKMREHAEIILNALKVAEFSDNWDGISAWGDTVVYKCVWVTSPDLKDRSRCYWKLILPNQNDESRIETVFKCASWIGYYELATLPPESSTVSQMEFEAFDAASIEASR